MKKRFVVCYSDNIPKEKEMHFIQFIKDNKLGWWHWISNMWLLVDSSGQMTASILRDKYVSFILKIELWLLNWMEIETRGPALDQLNPKICLTG